MLKKVPGTGFSDARKAMVEKAFSKYDPSSTGLVPLSVIERVYDAKKHPMVETGDLAPSVAKQAMHDALSPSAKQNGGNVSLQDFMVFHERMSEEIDLMKERNFDARFISLVSALWRVEEVRLAPTNIVPLTLDVPQGLYAVRKMHLVWPAEDGHLVGVRDVVKPVFARSWLPEEIRGYFLFSDEVADVPVTYVPAQSAIQPPFHIVWTDGDRLRGVSGAIVSNVDLTQVPTELRRHIVTAKEAVGKQIDFYPSIAPANPLYQTSNSTFGVNAQAYTAKVQQEKVAALSGKDPLAVYAGRVGKFTETFLGGMPKASGFNFTVKH